MTTSDIGSLKVFMDDGAEICSDDDLIEEIINGKLLILCTSFEEYNAKGKLMNGLHDLNLTELI